MYCKTIEKKYSPNIYWAPVAKTWIGVFNVSIYDRDTYGRDSALLSTDPDKSMEALKEMFNAYLVDLSKG